MMKDMLQPAKSLTGEASHHEGGAEIGKTDQR